MTNKKSLEDKFGYCIAISLCNLAIVCGLGNQSGLSVNPLFYAIFLFLSNGDQLLINIVLVSIIPFVSGYFGFLFANAMIENVSEELKNANLDEGIQLKMKKPKEVVFDV